MHGLGNDFVIIDTRTQRIDNQKEFVRKISNRHFGVGADQVIFLETAERADIFMRIFNSDGTESTSCGNATRCVADMIMDERGTDRCIVATQNRMLGCARDLREQITVDMGPPRLDWADIPLSRQCETDNLPIGGNGLSNPVAVNMGNPHCVFFVDAVDAVDVAKVGPGFEIDHMFPERANIEFVQVIDKTHIRMRVWERGTGITLACGSGACAAAVASIRRGLAARTMTVTMDGGDLQLEWRANDNHVYMTGPVTYVFKGIYAV